MKIIIEGDEKYITNIIKEKSLLVKRGVLTIEPVITEPEKAETKVKKEKAEPK